MPDFSGKLSLQWTVKAQHDLADTDLAENLDIKDIQKIWVTIFDFQCVSLLEIAENLDLADKSLATDFSAKSSFHCIELVSGGGPGP